MSDYDQRVDAAVKEMRASLPLCHKHKRYKGKQPPTEPCLGCWEAFLSAAKNEPPESYQPPPAALHSLVRAIRSELVDLETRVQRQSLQDLASAIDLMLNPEE